MTSEHQEAMCKACGGRIRRVGVGSNPGTLRGALVCENGHAIPAPVVPSDDECESRYRGQSCHLWRAHGGPHMNLDMGGHEWEDNTIGASAPPTPSQDAEGDGLAEGDLRQKAEEWEIDYRRWNRLPTKQAYAQQGARRVGFIAGFKAALESLGGRS